MPPEIDPNVPAEGDEYDVEALSKQVSGEMFPADPPEKVEPTEGTPPEKVEPKVEPTQIDPVAQLAELEAKFPLPKSWPKESATEWKDMKQAQRERVLAREADISRGIQMYQKGYSSWDSVTKPFESVLKQHPDIDVPKLYTNLMDSHLTLLGARGPEAKATKARELLAAYGITVEGLNAASPASAPASLPPAVMEKLSKLDGVEAFILEQQTQKVDAFFDDPKNEFASEVAPDIQRLLESGQAKDLPSAYEQALWLNPAVRDKLVTKRIAERDAEAKAAADKARRLNNLNRGKSSESNSEPAPRKGSMDDTISSVIEKHYPKH